MKKITFVTGNKHKVKEAEKILGFPFKFKNIDIDEIQTLDAEKIAVHKAEQAFERVKSPVIVDDVGVYLHAWKGFPGPLIKWVITSGENTTDVLLKMLEGEKNRHCTVELIIAFHDGERVHTFRGKVEGKIVHKEIGENGFYWDKVFIPKGHKKTYAQMTLQEKNKISHRKIALLKFKKFLNKQK